VPGRTKVEEGLSRGMSLEQMMADGAQIVKVKVPQVRLSSFLAVLPLPWLRHLDPGAIYVLPQGWALCFYHGAHALSMMHAGGTLCGKQGPPFGRPTGAL